MNKSENKFSNRFYKSQFFNLIPNHLSQNTQHIFQISTIILSSLIVNFSLEISYVYCYAIHHLGMSKVSSTSLEIPNDFGTMKENFLRTTSLERETNYLCN